MKAFAALPLLLLPSAAAGPVVGIDIAPFGVQGVWPNDPHLDEMLDLMQAAGVRVARFDLIWWNLAERVSGEFDFTSPGHPGYESWNVDRALEAMAARGIEPYAILCYGNAMYDGEAGPATAAGRAGFARFCRAAAERYRDQVDIWEIWNEPNLPEHWGREPVAGDYARMAIEAARAIRAADPEAIIVGGALSWMNIHEGMLERWFDYTRTLGALGLFDEIDAFSIHPYRVDQTPEALNPEFDAVRAIIAGHTSREVALWTGEWGFNTDWTEVGEVAQAKYLGRQFVNNMSQGVEMSIWFCFHPFDGWGMIEEETFAPRPAYHALRTANEVFPLPVRPVADPFGITAEPRPDDLRVEVFASGPPGRHVAALWLARAATEEGSRETVTLRVPSMTARVAARDGLTGASVSLEMRMERDALVLRDVAVPDHPLYLEITLP